MDGWPPAVRSSDERTQKGPSDKVRRPAVRNGRVSRKPSSVVDGYLSRTVVTRRLQRPTREVGESRHPSPIWSCCGWGLPSKSVTELLVRSYRTVSSLPAFAGGLFSVALSLGSPPLDVIQHPALCSSDFPPARICAGNRLADSIAIGLLL